MLKKYHPFGHLVNNQREHTGYLITCMSNNFRKAQPDETKLVSPGQFAELVKDDQMQLFEDNGRGPEVSYSPEEMKAYRIKETPSEQAYWNSDSRFSDVWSGTDDVVNISIVSAKRMLKQIILTGSAWLSSQYAPWYMNVAATAKTYHCTLTWRSQNFFVFQWPLLEFIRFVSESEYKISLNWDNMACIDNIIADVNPIGMKRLTPPEISQVANLLQQLLEQASVDDDRMAGGGSISTRTVESSEPQGPTIKSIHLG